MTCTRSHHGTAAEHHLHAHTNRIMYVVICSCAFEVESNGAYFKLIRMTVYRFENHKLFPIASLKEYST